MMKQDSESQESLQFEPITNLLTVWCDVTYLYLQYIYRSYHGGIRYYIYHMMVGCRSLGGTEADLW